MNKMDLDDTESVLGVLYDYFAEYQGWDNAEIKEESGRLYVMLSALKLQDVDMVIDCVVDICQLYQKAAFEIGFKAGVKMMLEAR